MSDVSPGSWAGSVRWAVVPFTPRPPFRVYAGDRHAPIVVAEVGTLITAARSGGDPELTYLVSGKARPVLVLSAPPAREHREIVALRLVRLSRLTAEEQRKVRALEDELLFHLAPDRFDLPEECAAMVNAIVRVHADAVDTGPSLGQLDGDEMRKLGERVVRFLGLDTRRLVERAIRDLAARNRERGVE